MELRVGFEPTTCWLLISCSGHLSYRSIWRREWDSNPRTPKSLRFSRPVHSTSYAIPPYVAERERFELSHRRTQPNGLANRPLIATWVPLHNKTKSKKNKDRNLRSKRSSWGILLFLYKLYRKRWHPLSRIAALYCKVDKNKGKECKSQKK